MVFNLYILPLGDGSCSVEEAGDDALFHMVWMVRGEVQISVCVGVNTTLLIKEALHIRLTNLELINRDKGIAIPEHHLSKWPNHSNHSNGCC